MISGPPLNDDLTRHVGFYSAGLTIEADPDSDAPRLSLDGQKAEIRRRVRVFHRKANGRERDVTRLAEKIIDLLWSRQEPERKRINMSKLKKRDRCNTWRRSNPDIRLLLFDAKLCGRNFADFSCCNANLIGGVLRGATLTRANFHEANLGRAHINDADLIGANFCRANLYETDVAHSANPQGTQLARINFSGDKLVGCAIYGLSAWNLNVEHAKQGNLKVLYRVPRADGSFENVNPGMSQPSIS
jgi:uncharacterized protein YjbI with pentapeptide repeats